MQAQVDVAGATLGLISRKQIDQDVAAIHPVDRAIGIQLESCAGLACGGDGELGE